MKRWVEHGRHIKNRVGQWRTVLTMNTATGGKGGPVMTKQRGQSARFGAFRQWAVRMRGQGDTGIRERGLDEEKGVSKETAKPADR